MKGKVHEIVATHFAAEIKKYGIVSLDTETGGFSAKKGTPDFVIKAMIEFAEQVEQAESQRGQTVRYERDEKPQKFLNTEIRYITGVDVHSEQTTTNVKINGVDFVQIKPCDILDFRADMARIFELYAITEDKI